jgi:N-terminal domain of (some) glycogen debranching enzymes
MLEPSEREEIREAWDIYKRHTLSNSIINGMVIRDDELTLVMQEDGEIPIIENYGYGLYYHDCRYLSGFLMRLMDTPPHGFCPATREVSDRRLWSPTRK